MTQGYDSCLDLNKAIDKTLFSYHKTLFYPKNNGDTLRMSS